MERQEISTSPTISLTTVQSRISHSLGNYRTDSTKFTILYRRPIFSFSNFYQNIGSTSAQDQKQTQAKIVLQTTIEKQQHSFYGNQKGQEPSKMVFPLKQVTKPLCKRSSNHFKLNSLSTKKPLRNASSRQVVATAHWQDSPLLDNHSFGNSKSLEVSQAAACNKPRKYLHLGGGALHTGQHTLLHGRRSNVIPTAITARPQKKLPPPPPLICISEGYTNGEGEKKRQSQSVSQKLLQSSRQIGLHSVIRSNEEPSNNNTSRPLSPLNLCVNNRNFHRYFMNNVEPSFNRKNTNPSIDFSIRNRSLSNDLVITKLSPLHFPSCCADNNERKSTIQRGQFASLVIAPNLGLLLEEQRN